MKRIVFLVVMLACASTVSINAERILSYDIYTIQ